MIAPLRKVGGRLPGGRSRTRIRAVMAFALLVQCRTLRWFMDGFAQTFSEEGETMVAASVVPATQDDNRDASFVRYEVDVDINERFPKRPVKLEKQTFFGQLLFLFLIRLPAAAPLGLADRTAVAFAAIHHCDVEFQDPNLNIVYYQNMTYTEVVEIQAIRCLVGRVPWDNWWAIIDRSEVVETDIAKLPPFLMRSLVQPKPHPMTSEMRNHRIRNEPCSGDKPHPRLEARSAQSAAPYNLRSRTGSHSKGHPAQNTVKESSPAPSISTSIPSSDEPDLTPVLRPITNEDPVNRTWRAMTARALGPVPPNNHRAIALATANNSVSGQHRSLPRPQRKGKQRAVPATVHAPIASTSKHPPAEDHPEEMRFNAGSPQHQQILFDLREADNQVKHLEANLDFYKKKCERLSTMLKANGIKPALD
ncbi:hypothetical protein NMY22_g1079 [Coprinellus aureogranulatus]|nr:hypothetical protein NMY22_g1079 [Coprinellus aureogranulatus]